MNNLVDATTAGGRPSTSSTGSGVPAASGLTASRSPPTTRSGSSSTSISSRRALAAAFSCQLERVWASPQSQPVLVEHQPPLILDLVDRQTF
jgi:hypothetical protein